MFLSKKFFILILIGLVGGGLLLLSSGNAQGGLWQSVGPGGGGWLSDVEYVQTTGELYTTLDCGGVRVKRPKNETWEISTKGIHPLFGSETEEVFVHPKDPKLVLLASWTGIYRSTNNGKSFLKVLRTGDGSGLKVNTFASDPVNPNVLYAGSGSTRRSIGFVNVEGNTDAQGVLWRSENKGKTWKAIFTFDQRLSIYTIIVDGRGTKRSSDNSILLTTNKGFWKSTDGGKSFVKKTQGLPENLRQAVQSPLIKTLLWVAVMYDGVYRSKDFGETWERIGPEEKHAFIYMAIDPNRDGKHQDTILVSAFDWHDAGGVWQVANARSRPVWKKIFPSQGIEKAWDPFEGAGFGPIAVGYPNGVRTIFLAVPGAQLYQSIDEGRTWKYLHTKKVGPGSWRGNGFELMILADGTIDPRNGALYFSYVDMGTFKSVDGGYSWKQLKAGGHFAGGNPETVAVNPLTGEVFVSVESGKVLASVNGGESFSQSFDKLTYQFTFDAQGGVYAATDDGVFARKGKVWERLGDLNGTKSLALVHETLYAANSEGVFVWSGNVWQKIVDVKNSIAGGLVIHPLGAQMLIATSDGLWRRDADQSLERIKKGSWEAIRGVGLTVYVKNRTEGIFRSTDFGKSWKQVTDNAYIDGFERGLVVDPQNSDHVYYGTKCMGVFQRDFSQVTRP